MSMGLSWVLIQHDTLYGAPKDACVRWTKTVDAFMNNTMPFKDTGLYSIHRQRRTMMRNVQQERRRGKDPRPKADAWAYRVFDLNRDWRVAVLIHDTLRVTIALRFWCSNHKVSGAYDPKMGKIQRLLETLNIRTMLDERLAATSV